MGKTPSLNLLKATKSRKDGLRYVGSKEGEGDHEKPLSSGARFFHEPSFNVYVIVQLGLKNPIDLDVVKANLFRLINTNHCFSSLPVRDKENDSMKWVPTHVNKDDHVIVPKIDLNMESSDEFIEEYISNLTVSCIDNSKPLWDVHILNTRTSDTQCTFIFRAHHSLGDGLSFMNLLLSLSRKASDPEALPTLPVNKKSHHHTTRITNFMSLLRVLWNTFVASVLFVLTMMFLKDTETPLKGSAGVENRRRRIVTRSVSLGDVKLVKNAMDVTVNDVIVGVIQAGFNCYLSRKYEENNNPIPDNIRLRAMISYNLRASTTVNVSTNTNEQDTWDFKVGHILLPFNVKHRSDPFDYVREAKAIMDRRKASLEPFVTRFFAKSLVRKLFGMKIAGKLLRKVYYNTTFCFSNMPGPQEKVCFLGQELTYLAPSIYGIPSALMIHVVSYVDKVIFVLSVEEETIPDPRSLCDDFQQSLQRIKCSVLAKPGVKN